MNKGGRRGEGRKKEQKENRRRKEGLLREERTVKEKRKKDGKERKIEIEEESKRKAEGYGGENVTYTNVKEARAQRVMKYTRRTTFPMHRPTEQENERFIPNYNPHRFEYC